MRKTVVLGEDEESVIATLMENKPGYCVRLIKPSFDEQPLVELYLSDNEIRRLINALREERFVLISP